MVSMKGQAMDEPEFLKLEINSTVTLKTVSMERKAMGGPELLKD